jgi:hypothetical protein
VVAVSYYDLAQMSRKQNWPCRTNTDKIQPSATVFIAVQFRSPLIIRHLEDKSLRRRRKERIGDGFSEVDDNMPNARWRHDLKNQLGIILGYSELILQQLDQSNPLGADVEEILKAVQCALTLVGQIESGE